MGKLLIYILALMVGNVAYGQMNLEAVKPGGVPTVELMPFTEIDINAPMLIRLERVSSEEECRIKYDLKGTVDSKFEFDVVDGVLKIRERSSSKRITISEAVIYYSQLDKISVSRAKVTFEQPVECLMFDIALSSEGVFVGDVESQDLKLTVSGRSRASITGESKYLSVTASSGSIVDLTQVSCIAAWVEASHSATVELCVDERLEVKSVMGAVVRYVGDPVIVRSERSLIGGEIFHIN